MSSAAVRRELVRAGRVVRLPQPSQLGLMCLLVGLVGAALALAIGAASRPSPLVPARKGGFGEWLQGPLDFGLSLRPWGFVVLLLGMCACYLCLLAWADRVPVRAALASIVALHVIFLLAP